MKLILVLTLGAALGAQAVDLKPDVVFASPDGHALKMDLSLPEGKMLPMVMCIHGGGWSGGHRRDFHQLMGTLSEWGYASATVDYRLTGVAPWPAQLSDVQAALKWLVDHAAEYRIDPERIIVLGGSAGGHLSLMLGALPEETGEGLRVRGVVNLFGPSDLQLEKVTHVRQLVEALVDGKLEERADVLKAASPLTFIDRTDAPVLTFHGTDDKLVPYEAQGVALHDALKAAKIPNDLRTMKGVGHTLGGDVEKQMKRLKWFLDAYLNGDGKSTLLAHEDFDTGTARWKPTDTAAWKPVKKDGRSFYSLIVKQSAYQPKVRSPHNIALLDGVEVEDFVFEADLRSTEKPYGHQSLCLFFGYQDPSHFYYVHFGRVADKHANSIFLVNDAPRVHIAAERTNGTDWSRGWHRARIRRVLDRGLIEVYLDDMEIPVMKSFDQTLGKGKVGIGSFDDTGDFDAIRLYIPSK